MEPGLPTSEVSGGHQSYGTRRREINIISLGNDNSNTKTVHSNLGHKESGSDISHTGGLRNSSTIIRNSSVNSSAVVGSGVPLMPLTKESLQLHNLQQLTLLEPRKCQVEILRGHISILETGATPTDRRLYGGQRGCEGTFEFQPLFASDTPQMPGEQRSITSTNREIETEIPAYEDSSRLSRSSLQEYRMDISDGDEHRLESSRQIMGWDKELTAWGNILAGIGEHFAGNEYQENTSDDSLVVDESCR